MQADSPNYPVVLSPAVDPVLSSVGLTALSSSSLLPSSFSLVAVSLLPSARESHSTITCHLIIITNIR